MRRYSCLFWSLVYSQNMFAIQNEQKSISFIIFSILSTWSAVKMTVFKISKCAYYNIYECMHVLSSFNRKLSPLGEQKRFKLLENLKWVCAGKARLIFVRKLCVRFQKALSTESFCNYNDAPICWTTCVYPPLTLCPNLN